MQQHAYTIAQDAFAKESVTVSTVAVGLTPATFRPSGVPPAQYVFLSVDADKIRVWFDGSDPTAAIGHELVTGSILELHGIKNIERLRMIRSGAADATVRASYFRKVQ